MTEVERQAALRQVGQDGCWLLERLEASASEAVRGLEAVQTLQTVWAQRYERAEGQVAVRTQTVPSTELLVSPHAPGVRAGQKRGKGWQGEQGPVTETAEPDQPNFITEVTTANASSGDGEALPGLQGRKPQGARATRSAKQPPNGGHAAANGASITPTARPPSAKRPAALHLPDKINRNRRSALPGRPTLRAKT